MARLLVLFAVSCQVFAAGVNSSRHHIDIHVHYDQTTYTLVYDGRALKYNGPINQYDVKPSSCRLHELNELANTFHMLKRDYLKNNSKKANQGEIELAEGDAQIKVDRKSALGEWLTKMPQKIVRVAQRAQLPCTH